MPKREKTTVTIEKPANFSDFEWAQLSPAQKVQYASNPSLFKPGESGKARRKNGKGIKGRPRNDGLPPIQKGQREVIIGSIAPAAPPPAVQPSGGQVGQVQEEAFAVEEAETIKDSVEANGVRLLNDAYRRAAKASTSGDPFDRAVYLTLLGKAHPMATLGGSKQPLSGEAKRRKKALEELLARHSAQDATFTPVVEQAQAAEEDEDDGE